VEARVSHLWRHPIKGHGVEAVASVTLAAGATMPWDRVWAIAHEAARVRPGASDWAQCANFTRGAKSFELMAIRAEVDETAGRVTLSHPRREPLTVDPDDAGDAARLVAWVTPLSNPDRAQPAFVVRAGRGMTDSDFPSVSILNRASLDALGHRIGRPLAMERFRGNVWLDGLEPFADGSAPLRPNPTRQTGATQNQYRATQRGGSRRTPSPRPPDQRPGQPIGLGAW
jgi:uncharacterized protein YcbX